MPNQAPGRQITDTPVTPIVGDVLVSTTLQFERRELPAYGTTFANMVKVNGYNTKYVDHQFSLAVPEDGQATHFTCYFVAPRANQDNYNFEHIKADIGGNKFDAVVRSYVVKRTDYNPTSPAMGSAMPNTPTGQFPTYASHILAARKETRLPKELDSLYVAEERTYVKKETITDIGTDSISGLALSKVSTIYHKDEVVTGSTTAAQIFAAPTNSYWGTQSSGYVRTGRQISAEFYEIVNEQVVAGSAAGGAITLASYTTNENYYWPPVLSGTGMTPSGDGLEFMDWVRNDGGTDIFPRINFNPEAYNGPCAAAVTVAWKSAPFTIASVDKMQPRRIYYACPFYTLNVPECLHPAVTCQCDIGTSDPEYAQNTGSSRTFAATNYTAWPDSITAFDDQKPYRGGFLRTTVVISKPS